MKGLISCILFSVLVGCTIQPAEPILVPEFDSELYLRAIDQVDNRLKSDPNSQKLIDQKLFYCEQLGWPEDCFPSLMKRRSQTGMNSDLLEKFVAYYAAHQLHEDIVKEINQWRSEDELSVELHESLIKSLVALGQRSTAVEEINHYLFQFKDPEAKVFVAGQYLAMKDTLRATYHASSIWKLDPSNPFMMDYGKLLFSLGYPQRGTEVLETHYSTQEEHLDHAYAFANYYETQSQFSLARNKIKPYVAADSILFYLNVLYQKEGLLDSAIMCMDTVLSRNPVSLKALITKGEVYEKKRWFSSSLRMFQQALALDSADTSISNRIALIQGKIAYLQRRKFEENKVPLLQLESKKINFE